MGAQVGLGPFSTLEVDEQLPKEEASHAIRDAIRDAIRPKKEASHARREALREALREAIREARREALREALLRGPRRHSPASAGAWQSYASPTSRASTLAARAG